MVLERTRGRGPRFPGILNTPFHPAAPSLANTLKSPLANTYKIKDPEHIRPSAAVSGKTADLNKKLTALSDALKLIPAAIAAEPAVAPCLKDIQEEPPFHEGWRQHDITSARSPSRGPVGD
jgi:hypothetical protein